MGVFDIAQDAADVVDRNAGSGDFKPPREGIALLRMCSYVELGTYEGEWKGKRKENKKVLVEFECLHPDHKIVNKEGAFKGYHRIMVRVNKSGHAKSKYMMLFNKLNYNGKVHVEKDKIPALSKFLGDPFLGVIIHSEYKSKVYANLDKDGEYTVNAPQTAVLDAGVPTGKYDPIPVPEMHVMPKLFLWEAPGMPNSAYHEMWESIFIEGEKDDGTSKNWIQNMILSDDNIALPGSKAEELFKEQGSLSNLDLSPLADPSLM